VSNILNINARQEKTSINVSKEQTPAIQTPAIQVSAVHTPAIQTPSVITAILQKSRMIKNKTIQNIKDPKDIVAALDEIRLENKLDIFHVNMALMNCLRKIKRDRNNVDKESLMQIVQNIMNFVQGAGLSLTKETYGTLIELYSKLDRGDMSFTLFNQIRQSDIQIDNAMYNIMLGIYVEIKDAVSAQKFFDDMLEGDYMKPDVVTYSIMINMYGKMRKMKEAFAMFDSASEHGIDLDIAIYNLMIDLCCQIRDKERMRVLLADMQSNNIKKNVTTYILIIKFYGKVGKVYEVASYFDEMIKRGIKPDVIVYNSVISAFSRMRMEEEAVIMFRQIIADGHKPTNASYNIMIDLYVKIGNEKEAITLMDEMKLIGLRPDIIAYGSIINMYCKQFDEHAIDKVMLQMKEDGIRPDSKLYSAILDMHKKSKNYDKAVKLFLHIKNGKDFLLDAVIFNNMMEIEVQRSGRKNVEVLYKSALGFFAGKSDLFSVTNGYIDAMFQFAIADGKFQEFHSQCREGYMEYVEPFYPVLNNRVDCHGMTPGSYAMLRLIYKDNIDDIDCNIGAELHSKGKKKHRLSAVQGLLSESV